MKPGEVEEFTIGPSPISNLPNIPLKDAPIPNLKWVSIQSQDLIGPKSMLHSGNTIEKFSFYFEGNSRRSGPQQMVVDEVEYSSKPVPILLDVGGCTTLF